MTELLFMVDEEPEGGYVARAVNESIFTEADDLDTLRANIKDAVQCHFDEGRVPSVVRLHFVRDEVLAT